jgi:hypothetical protein
MNVLRIVTISLISWCACAAAEPLVLPDGGYQLIRARTSEDKTGANALSAANVTVSHKGGKTFIVIEGMEAEVRTDEYLGFLVATPYRPEATGVLVSELILFGKVRVRANNALPFPPLRVEGEYLVVFPGGEERGNFALVPIQAKNG